MKELSHGAREILERGLAFDGPSDEQRARVKQRMLASIGGGAVVLGSAASAVGAGASAGAAAALSGVTGVAAATAAKGVLAGSLWLWFGVGIAAGVGVSGVAVVASRVSEPPSVQRSASAAGVKEPLAATEASLSGVTEPEPAPFALTPEPPPEIRPGAKAPPSGATPGNEPSGPAAASAVASTLHEEAALLQGAQRALAAAHPDQALSLLAEHERRFPRGALLEERQAARVLALCALGRSAEARTLAQAFLAASPRSVLIPRLESSCAGAALKR